MNVRLFLILSAAVLLAGCATVVDARNHSQPVCEIHHGYMQSVRISGRPVGAAPPTQEYLEARVKGFRHSYPLSLPLRIRTKYVIHLCDECVAAETEWKKAHPALEH